MYISRETIVMYFDVNNLRIRSDWRRTCWELTRMNSEFEGMFLDAKTLKQFGLYIIRYFK